MPADINRATAQEPSVYGSLLLKGAVAAASLDDRRAVSEYLERAQQVAELTSESNRFWFTFGPTNVAIHRVWLELELGDPVAAVSAVDAVRTDALPTHLAERRASHLITVAWAQYLRRKDDLAVAALIELKPMHRNNFSSSGGSTTCWPACFAGIGAGGANCARRPPSPE